MNKNQLSNQVDAFIVWKKEVIRQLTLYRTWLKEHHLGTREIDIRLNEAQGALQTDKITLAFVGEFSRGKTELINALFFSQYGQRMLPSKPGRTTMCPTELFFDLTTRDSYVKLLPIETRAQTTTLKELKHESNLWVHVPLDLSSPDKISRAFTEVASNKLISKKDAVALGFEINSLEESHDDTSKVVVPAWRHALISFEHPLLRQGLRIIDTPGLNALGCEPELTFSLLPEAHAVLFMLSADTGVTDTDLKIWNNHIRGLSGHINSGMYAVLNKIDVLWDDPDCEDIEKEYFNDVRQKTAKTLGIPTSGIIPLSAKMGLLGKLNGDMDLLDKSHLPEFERLLSNSIVAGKEAAIQESIVNDVLSLLQNSRTSIRQRLTEINQEKLSLSNSLKDSRGQFTDLNKKTKAEQAFYHKRLLLLKSSHKLFQKQAPKLLAPIKQSKLDGYLAQLQEDFSGTWSSKGAGKATQTFFKSIEADFQLLKEEAEQAENIIADTYSEYGNDQFISTLTYPILNIDKHIHDLTDLQTNSSRYGSSVLNILSERAFVSKRFYATIAEESKRLYKDAFEDTRNWCKFALSPILQHAQQQKKMLDDHLVKIRGLAQSGSSTKEQVQKLELIIKKLEKQMAQIDSITKALKIPAPTIRSKKVVAIGGS
ncbi:MAG: dynamin family protein [Pseudomonadales bacterium]|nr:dynamin family protein [Pseudomonadales bacterium]